MAKSFETMYKACEVLPDCLCNLELPHTAEHSHRLPRQIMPVLRFPSEAVAEDEKKKRVQDLLSDFSGTRADDRKLKEKFEKRAEQLMKELKAEEPKYTWLPKEEGPIENSGDRLKYELEQSRFQLAEIRNQMHTLKRELTLYRRLVRQEVGGCQDLHHLLMDKNWKGRAEEIERLKSEIALLESKAYGHKYLKNPITIPHYNPRFPRVDDLIPKTQVAVLKREVIRRKEEAEAKEVSTFMKEYGNLALMYKASSTHNKVLAEELRSLKDQLDQHEKKAKDDLELIKTLTAHQMQMRLMFEREAHLATLVDKKQREDKDSASDEKFDAQKYKTLWETSEYQKQSLYEMVRVLTERLDDVMEKADEAEKHCQETQDKKKQLEEQLKVQKKARIASAKEKKPKVKKHVAGGQTLPVAEQLEAVKEENKFLKTFLRRAIDAKEEDLKLYRFTMQSIREQYLEALEKIKKMKEEQKDD